MEGYGAFVDVFPLDFLPESREEMEKVRKKYYRKLQILTHAARTSYERTDSKTLNMKRALAFAFTRFVDPHKIVRKINDDFKAFNNKKTGRVGYGCYKTAWLLEDYLETSEVLAPKDPDRVLSAHFGNYMQLPPEDQRIPNHQLECYYLD